MYNKTILTNGLAVASEKLPGVESVAIAVSVDVGARYETDDEQGISHLLEHMAFKGTEKRSARQIAEAFDAIGGHFNAYTSMEHTVYHVKVLAEYVPLAIEIIADILQHSAFIQEELKREQEVIVQEIAMHQDTPDDLIFDIYDSVAWPDQPLGRSILGTPDHVNGFSAADLQAYMDLYYQPRRMVVSAAGNIDHATLTELIEQYFTFTAPMREIKLVQSRYVGGEMRLSRDLEQLHLLMGVPGVSIHDEAYVVQQLYVTMLGGGMSSRLFQEIRENRGLVYHISAMGSAYSDCGMISVYAATSPNHAEELAIAIGKEVKRIALDMTEKELLRAQHIHKSELLMARESTGAIAGMIGRHNLVFGRYINAAELISRIEKVTLEDVRALAETVITLPPTLAALGPHDTLPPYQAIMDSLRG